MNNKKLNTALVVIDIQNDYFSGGAFELQGPEQAADKAKQVIDAFRAAQLPIFHIQHATPPNHPLPAFIKGTPGQHIHPKAAPLGTEIVIEKNHPSSFQGTDLEERLRSVGIERLVIVGMMTQVCVCSTAHSAYERGFAVTVIGDATATRALLFGDETVPAEWVLKANLASLDRVFATVTTADAFCEELAPAPQSQPPDRG